MRWSKGIWVLKRIKPRITRYLRYDEPASSGAVGRVDWKTREWILEIMRKARALTKAVQDFDEECNEQSSFDFQDARVCFDEVKVIVADLEQLLAEEVEGEEEENGFG